MSKKAAEAWWWIVFASCFLDIVGMFILYKSQIPGWHKGALGFMMLSLLKIVGLRITVPNENEQPKA